MDRQDCIVSWMDGTRKQYERKTLLVGGSPFFYNGVQIRVDKVFDTWGYGEKELSHMFEVARNDGFTVANAQIRWQDIQPDHEVLAESCSYIRGGDFATTVFNMQKYIMSSYSHDPSEQMLAVFSFDFNGLDEQKWDGAKIRIYVNQVKKSEKIYLYGLECSEHAEGMTWNNQQKWHTGYKISGKQCHDLGPNPDCDPVSGPHYYDFDVTEFINQYCSDNKKAFFILQAAQMEGSLVCLEGTGARTPRLFLSNEDVYDWSKLDHIIDWADHAGIKLEILWFGTDTVNLSVDSRVPYYVFHKYQKSLKEDGSPFIRKEKVPFSGMPSVYWHLMCKNDSGLREKEKKAVRMTFDHIADKSKRLQDKFTVIGCQVANEPAVAHLHEEVMGAHCYCPECIRKKGELSEQEFRDQTMWEYCNNIAAGVKESGYSVWTRVNNLKGTDAEGVAYNEKMRKKGGTNLDFIGFDPYSPDLDESYRFGNESYYSQGENLPMIMENSGRYPNTVQLIMAALAGGSYYNVYDLCGPDTHGLYDNTKGNEMKPHGSYVEDVRKLNQMLRKVAYELATKSPDGEGGKGLVFFNEKADIITRVNKSIRSVKVEFSSYEQGIGMMIDHSETELIFLCTNISSYIFKGICAFGVQRVSVGYCNGKDWVDEEDLQYELVKGDLQLTLPAFTCARIKTERNICEGNGKILG